MKGTGSVADIVGGIIAFGWLLGLLTAIALGVFLPLMVFFIMRHLKGIRHELSTLNETLQNKLVIR